MLPNQYIDLSESDFEVEEEQNTETYKMHILLETINGKTDEQEAMIQAIYKILNTERYAYPIYSDNYGIELIDLIGEDAEWVCPELQRRIEEALLQDERIKEVSDFDFTIEDDKIHVSFTASTIFGDTTIIKEVKY